jgi:hypothetical protein
MVMMRRQRVCERVRAMSLFVRRALQQMPRHHSAVQLVARRWLVRIDSAVCDRRESVSDSETGCGKLSSAGWLD